MAYTKNVLFIETPIFTKEILDLLSDKNYHQLQQVLVINPRAGKLIPASNGLRKIRWNLPGTGKRGGLRVIYYWDSPRDTIYMLLPYKKSKKKDLTKEQIKILGKIVKEYIL